MKAIKRLAYRRKDAAAILGISAGTLDRLCAAGKLRAVKVLRIPLFTQKELERFRNTKHQKPNTKDQD